jgi:hypothetical protein
MGNDWELQEMVKRDNGEPSENQNAVHKDGTRGRCGFLIN